MAQKPNTKISKRTLLGAILILAGLAVFLVPSLSPASIFIENKELTVSAGEHVNLRYGYLNEGDLAYVFNAILYDENSIVTDKQFLIQPKTIYSGMFEFNAPDKKGRYTYTLKIGSEKQTIMLEVR